MGSDKTYTRDANNRSSYNLKNVTGHVPRQKTIQNTGFSSKNDSLLAYAKKNSIAVKTLPGFEEATSGYYIVYGVYGNVSHAKKKVEQLKRKGFGPNILPNTENRNSYVYLKHFLDWRAAIDTCASEFDDAYHKDIWILEVENHPAIAIEDVTYGMISELVDHDQGGNVANKNPNKSSLIKKADSYFDKMWYAEAAELYEEVLRKNEESHSFEIIQKTGDAHYFNTNMEKAVYWYDILYGKYENEMSTDHLFKYAHSLKGTGKYARAKKLMRLYHRKTEKNEVRSDGYAENEMVLEGILGKEMNFDIKNMSINSKYSDFSPMFLDSDKIVFASAKDSSIYTTRTYKWNNQPYLDLYVAKINEESQDLTDAVKFSKKINSKYHEAAITFSPDNNTLYFTRNNYGKRLKRDKKGINHLKIYKSKKVDGEWTEAIELPFNSDDYSTGHPALSPDGKKLYFVSDMPGSIGETDIFVVDVLGDDLFSEPRNLGPTINTERKEMFPFVNDKKLYFSSDGHTGLGGLDIYGASYDEDGFGKAINVGRPVNSNKDDISFIVNEETQKGFFASNREGGKGDDDIYSFIRSVEELDENRNAIAGVVTEMVAGNIMPHALVQLWDENNVKLAETATDENGNFVFDSLKDHTRYILKASHEAFFDSRYDVATTHDNTVNTDIAMKRLEEIFTIEDGVRKLKTETIRFDFDRYNVRPDAAKELDKLVQIMNEYSDMVIKIESHTDSRGKKAYNRYLSDNRAKATRDYIISQGIAPERIESAIGYGEDRLLNSCNGTIACSEQNHSLNRRSEFIIVKM